MPSLPRIITVDPTGTIASVVRAAMHLIDRSVIQIDVPGGNEALEEIGRGNSALVITALEIGDDMRGFELALRVKQTSAETGVVILADIDDPEELDEETASNSPFVYLHRPVNVQQFLGVLLAALNGEDLFGALAAPTPANAVTVERGPVPDFDKAKSQPIIDSLLHDVGGMAIVLADRKGEVILERGAVGFFNRTQLTTALLPMMTTTIDMGELVGGQPSVVQFYDGDDKDVFVFSVGLHHFLCVVFDGQAGARQFGIVNRYGRKAAEDLIALLGANAFIIEKPRPVEKEEPRPKKKKQTQELDKLEPVLVRPDVKVTEPEPFRLEPLADLDVDIFGQLADMDDAQADDLFNPDRLAEIVEEQRTRKGGPITFDEAQELGIVADPGAGGA